MEIIFWNETLSRKLCHLKTKDLGSFRKSQKKMNFRKNKISSRSDQNQSKRAPIGKIAKIEIDISLNSDNQFEYDLRVVNFSEPHSPARDFLDEFLIVKTLGRDEKTCDEKFKNKLKPPAEAMNWRISTIDPICGQPRRENAELEKSNTKSHLPFANFNQKSNLNWSKLRLESRHGREAPEAGAVLSKRGQLRAGSLAKGFRPIHSKRRQLYDCSNGKFKLF